MSVTWTSSRSRRCYLLLLPRPRPRGSIPPPPLSKRLGLPMFRPQEETTGNDRDEKESGHVTDQVPPMRGGHRLNRHDAAVNHARPDCEPDQAAMGLRVSRCSQQEDAERRIYPDDHHAILGI